MSTFQPSAPASQLNRVPEELASGPYGAVDEQGHEFDMPVARPPPPEPRSSRPRPVSMPPQAFNNVLPVDPAAIRRSIDEARPRQETQQPPTRSSRSSGKILGDYTLGKTLGQGSMGKVKLAQHSVSGEKVRLRFAIKIVPRVQPTPLPAGATQEAIAKQQTKDASKEIRTIREASLCLLLHHPYICGMRELIVHQHHYYMVTEYVNGGQMLDYIISHGRLRERVARKFARQIGSALEYCHKNNVVHRDLKIENILISHTGNIKIIDFGLSNLYNPASHLSTFCGSLYFAAPELLLAKVYAGPEVDVWSFGVVLYVLVCGKVPFDDQSMPALHAKIKRGLVEYPVWLSAECKHLLSRMLVTNPTLRANLHEVLNHPWMTRNFSGPPEPHLVHREPLRPEELDMNVIRGMTGFEFGTPEDIHRKLVGVLESDSYVRAVVAWSQRRGGMTLNGGSSTFSFDSGTGITKEQKSPATPKKRFSGFDFYRRKFFSPGTSPPGTPAKGSPASSGSSVNNNADSANQLVDPSHGFHPLVSIYFLVREKQERERVYGPGVFASSQLSLQAHTIPRTIVSESSDPSVPPSSYVPPISASLTPSRADSAQKKADYNMPLPRLPAPESSHYSGMSYDVPTSIAAPSPTAAAFSPQPQPRTHDLPLSTVPPSPAPSTPKSPVPTTLPRAPPVSTHRRSHSLSQRPSTVRPWNGPQSAMAEITTFREAEEHQQQRQQQPARVIPEIRTVQPTLDTQPNGSANGTYNSTSEKEKEKEREKELPDHPLSPTASLARKFGSLLVGSRGDHGQRPSSKRTSILSMSRPSAERDEKENEPVPVPAVTLNEKVPAITLNEKETPVQTLRESASQPLGSVHRRAMTVLDPAGRAARHERRSSMGAASFMGHTLGRRTKPPSSAGAGAERFERLDEREGEGVDEHGLVIGGVEGEKKEEGGEKDFKPVFLKGLFSVATTSTKQPSVIKTDVRRVLDRMQVQYRDTKSGFECIHLPSIDLSTLSPAQTERFQAAQTQNKRTLGRKASKPLKGKEKELAPLDEMREKEHPTTIGSSGSSSFFNTHLGVPPTTNTTNTATGDAPQGQGLESPQLQPQESDPNLDSAASTRTKAGPGTAKYLPPIPRDFAVPPTAAAVHAKDPSQMSAEESFNEAFNQSMRNGLAVRFEINIVKVPWLPLHGIQFRRVGGDGWQYQMLARRVLTELKL
ncbi:hypothetical protein M422DRAFT_58800 [Sphaerobolus stellatus SS14]|nr:hypothetical protein M422DRAFT_58800 [Sphaerobolus stellatus SS14]